MAGGLTFGVLGPLRIERDGAPVDAGGAKFGAVIALLLLHEGEVIPRDTLVDAIWGGVPASHRGYRAAGTCLQAEEAPRGRPDRPARHPRDGLRPRGGTGAPRPPPVRKISRSRPFRAGAR